MVHPVGEQSESGHLRSLLGKSAQCSLIRPSLSLQAGHRHSSGPFLSGGQHLSVLSVSPYSCAILSLSLKVDRVKGAQGHDSLCLGNLP
jgi:hypothetical protein